MLVFPFLKYFHHHHHHYLLHRSIELSLVLMSVTLLSLLKARGWGGHDKKKDTRNNLSLAHRVRHERFSDDVDVVEHEDRSVRRVQPVRAQPTSLQQGFDYARQHRLHIILFITLIRKTVVRRDEDRFDALAKVQHATVG